MPIAFLTVQPLQGWLRSLRALQQNHDIYILFTTAGIHTKNGDSKNKKTSEVNLAIHSRVIPPKNIQIDNSWCPLEADVENKW